MSRRSALFTLGLILFCAAAVAIRFIPFSHPEGDFALSVLDCLRTGHVSSTFLPDLYPFVCTFFYKHLGPIGIIGFQAALYFAVAACVFLVIRRVSGQERGAALATGLIMLDPDLLSSITKVWDTELTVLFLILLVFLSLLLKNRRTLVPPALGLVWGLSLALRPNFALLAVPFAYAVFLPNRRTAAVRGALVAALAFATLAAANTAAHGSFYLPQNGPYNFLAGANQHTRAALLHDYNAEPSIALAMADHGYPAVDSYDLKLKPVYTRFARDFVQAHPFKWLGLGFLKLATLLRPDTKTHPLWTPAGLVKLLTSLSTPLWLVVLAWARSLRRVDMLFVLFAVAYVLPFVITNADPRFRPALDVLVLTHAAILILRRIANEQLGKVSPENRTGAELNPA